MTGKKRIFAGMGILLGVLVGVQGTSAYQSAYDKAVNIVTPGNISSEIGEDFPNPPTIVPDKDIDIAKKIWVSNNPSGQNQTGTDCYVRVAVGYSNSDIGKAVTMKIQIAKIGFTEMMDFIIIKRSSGKASQQHSFAQDFLLIMPELKKILETVE